jgi:hypothetical protein
MEQQHPPELQPQGSRFWLAFSTLCAGASILASIITINNAQRYTMQ